MITARKGGPSLIICQTNYVDRVQNIGDDKTKGQVWIEKPERLQGYIRWIAVCGTCRSLTPTITIPVYFFVQISSPILFRFRSAGVSSMTFHSKDPSELTCTETIIFFGPWNTPM